MNILPPRDVSDYSPVAHKARCDLCPLAGSRYVPYTAPESKLRLAIVGEGPGRKEVIQRTPFCGQTGQILNQELETARLDRGTAHITNAALCVGDTDEENERAAECCAPRILHELADLPPEVPIVLLGKAAAKAVLGVKSILLARGFIWTARDLSASITSAEAAVRKAERLGKPEAIVETKLRLQTLKARHRLAGRTILPTLHPTFAFVHNETWAPIFHIDLDRAARWIRGELTAEMLEDRITPVKSASALRRGKDVFLVTDNVKAIEKASAILGREIACDIETERLKPLSPLLARTLTVQLSDGVRSLVIAPWDPRLHAKILTRIFKGRTVVFHNGFCFDHPALERDGVDLSGCKLEDTLVAHHAFASQYPQKLDHVVATFCDSSPWKIRFGVRGAEEKGLAPTHMEEDDLALYGACDAVLTIKAWRAMQRDLASEYTVYEHDKLLGIQGKMMQVDGFRVDRKRRRFLSRGLKRRAAHLKGRLRTLSRRPNFSPSRLGDVRHVLFGVLKAPMLNPTKTGLASTSNATLEVIRTGGAGTARRGPADSQGASGPINNETRATKAGRFAEALLRWRVAMKIQSTYIEAVQVHKDGRAHYNWKAYGTNSGRYSCRLQSCPRWSMAIEDRPREMYLASPGGALVYFDLSQAEARFAANLSGDENFINTCKGDVHTGNAKILFPQPDALEKLNRDPKGKHCPQHGEKPAPGALCNCGKPFRDIAKNAGFAVAYLAEVATVFAYLRAHGFPVELDDVDTMLTALKNSYKQYYQYVYENVAFVEQHGYLRTPLTGRIRWFGFHPKPQEIANCCDEETEALTQRGWIRGFDLRVGDKLLTKNITTGLLTWEPISKLRLFPQYEGPLFHFQSRNFNALTTAEHRWLVTDRQANTDRAALTSELAEGTGTLSIHRTGTYAAPTAQIYSDAFVELVGWVLTDGRIQVDAPNVCVYQTQAHNIPLIDSLFVRLGCPAARDVRIAENGVERVVWRLHGGSSVAHELARLFPLRTLTSAFLSLLTVTQLHMLLSYLMGGDGSVTSSKTTFFCRDKARADIFQVLCTLCGRATSAHWRGPTRPKKQYASITNRPQSKGIWIVTLLHKKTAQVLRHPKRYGKCTKLVDHVAVLPAGTPRKVWCPIVRNTFFVARRRGDVFITGNTPIQSGIADVMNTRLLVLQGQLAKATPAVRLVAQVHDAAIFDVPIASVETVKTLIVRTWDEPVRLKPSVVCRSEREFFLPAEIKVGRRWSDFG